MANRTGRNFVINQVSASFLFNIQIVEIYSWKNCFFADFRLIYDPLSLQGK